SSRRRHTRFSRDWSSDVCSSDLRRGNYRSMVLMSQLGYGSDMIEVTMSAGDSLNPSINVLHYAVIGNGAYVDQVCGMQGLYIGILMNLHPIQPDPHIHHYNIFSYHYRRRRRLSQYLSFCQLSISRKLIQIITPGPKPFSGPS